MLSVQNIYNLLFHGPYIVKLTVNNFGHDRLEMDQHFSADHFSRDLSVMDEMCFGRSVIAGTSSLISIDKKIPEIKIIKSANCI